MTKRHCCITVAIQAPQGEALRQLALLRHRQSLPDITAPIYLWVLEMRRFTKKELAQYNGKNGAPAFIAYRGKVYDVSRSFLWQDGRHQVLHTAGVDLTASLDQAPHGADLLERCPVIGMLDED